MAAMEPLVLTLLIRICVQTEFQLDVYSNPWLMYALQIL